MARKKKISITYYLNKALNPIQIKDETHYRVYARITFNRHTTRILFFVEDHGYLTEDQFEEIFVKRSNPVVNLQIKAFENQINKIVRFESEGLGDNYNVSGISNRLEIYRQPMARELEKHLQKQLHKITENKLPDIELSSIFHEAIFLTDSYLIIEKQLPSFQEMLPESIVDQITAYLQFSHFRLDPPKVLLCLDWLDLSTKIAFKDFLFKQPEISELLPMEAPHSPFFQFYRKFPIKIEKISTYLKSIDNMLLQIAT